ncbi:MAG: hypothetical protein KA761_15900, partial [Gemmatimonadaceae bacterium]|nr:hypothetical protein [Gemmatimonadaceae bacterium]
MNQPPLSPYDLDVTPAPMPPVLSPSVRSAVHEATKRAYHQARANGASVGEAEDAGARAGAEAALEVPAYMPPEQPDDLPVAQSHAESEEAGVDAVGLARSEADKLAAERAGFAPAPTVYTRGLRVIQAGVDAAEASRADFDRKPKVSEACETFRGRIASEKRQDVATDAVAIAMHDDGKIHDLSGGYAGPAGMPTRTGFPEMRLEQGAFENLVSRLGYGGGRYLADKCTPELRAHNVNAQRDRLDDEQEAERVRAAEVAAEQKTANKWAPRQVVLRTRRDRAAKDPTARSTFAVVSPTYAPFDADLVAEAIAQATPPEARGSIAYDGRRTRFEILFQSTVQPRHFVAGEFFRAGVIVRTDDTGGGSVRGSSV